MPLTSNDVIFFSPSMNKMVHFKPDEQEIQKNVVRKRIVNHHDRNGNNINSEDDDDDDEDEKEEKDIPVIGLGIVVRDSIQLGREKVMMGWKEERGKKKGMWSLRRWWMLLKKN